MSSSGLLFDDSILKKYIENTSHQVHWSHVSVYNFQLKKEMSKVLTNTGWLAYCSETLKGVSITWQLGTFPTPQPYKWTLIKLHHVSFYIKGTFCEIFGISLRYYWIQTWDKFSKQVGSIEFRLGNEFRRRNNEWKPGNTIFMGVSHSWCVEQLFFREA